ncbi:MAG: thioester reductase domain-containing protein [Alphaproteobacteria bacterium]|nr:thioester reductase domain-containing protein [Alphaproteobacteria bacterium]
MSLIKSAKFIFKNLGKFLSQQYAYSRFNLRHMPKKEDMFRASNCQKRFYTLQSMDESSVAYTVNGVATYMGKINVDVFQKAINLITEKNEIFRTTFVLTEEGLMQKVNPVFQTTVGVYHLDDDSVEVVENLMGKITTEPFDLAQLPLFRISLIFLPGEQVKLLTNFHHAIWDAWSQFSFYKELARVYNQLMQGDDIKLADKPIDYRHYAYVEGQTIESGDKKTIAYYYQYLKKFEPMDFNFIKSKNSSKKAHNFNAYFSHGTVNNIRKRCEELNCSMHDFMLACFLMMIFKYTRNNHVASMIPRFSRFNKKILSVYGPMLNALPIIVDSHDDVVFSDFVQSVKTQIRTLFKYDNMPYDYILEQVQNEKDAPSIGPIPLLFNYLSQHWFSVDDFSELVYLKNELVSKEVDFLMAFYIVGFDRSNQLAMSVTYQKDKIDFNTMKIVVDHYRALIQKVSKDPSKAFKDYALECNDLPNIPNYLSWPKCHARFSPVMKKIYENALSQPNSKALITGNEQTSYGELADLSAYYFDQLESIEKNDVVAISGVRDKRFYAAMLAALSAGATIYIFDPNTDKKLLQSTLTQINPRYCLLSDTADGKYIWQLKEVFHGDVTFISLGENIDRVRIENHPILNHVAHINESDRAYVCSTSGSTGVPKIVQVAHGGLCHFIEWQVNQFKITSDDTCAQLTNPNFDVCYREIFTPLYAGGVLVVPDSDDYLTQGNFFQWLMDKKITFFHTVPSILNLLSAEISNYEELALTELRWVFSAGEPLHSELIKTIRSRVYYFPTLVNLYGPTETCLAKAYYVVPMELKEGVQPVGNPLPKTEIYVLNSTGTICGMGEAGEIHIRPPFTVLGYLDGNPEKFKINPHTQNETDKIYATGDLGYWDDKGLLHVIGRLDDQVKINGIRVELDAIKQAIMKHPDVRMAAVIYDANKLTAFYSLKEMPQETLQSSIQAHTLDLLPPHMHPNSFVELDEIPLLPSGKINKRALKAMVVAPTEEAPITLPVTQTEKKLYEIWAAVLKNDKVSTTAPHKNVGLNSLLVIQVILSIKKHMKLTIKPIEFVQYKNLKEIAQLIDSRAGVVQEDESLVSFKTVKELKALVPVVQDLENLKPANPVHAHIFLTGMPGFLGCYLLRDLLQTYPKAKISILIRAKDIDEAKLRMEEAFQRMSYKPSPDDWQRIDICIGDLQQANFGFTQENYQRLAESVDSIYHAGAFVNFLYDYEALEKANVFGTHEVIRLASAHQVKPISYVSTAGIFPARKEFVDKYIQEDFDIDFGDEQRLYGGYAQTKWVAEKLMHGAAEKGIPISVYRLGRIGGDSQTGFWPQNDFIYCFLKTVHDLSSIPDLPLKIDLLPVDLASKIIVEIEKASPYQNRSYNLINPNRISITEMQGILSNGNSKPSIDPYVQWRQKIIDSLSSDKPAALGAFVGLLPEEHTALPRLQYDRLFAVDNVLEALQGTNVVFTAIDKTLIQKYLNPDE